MFGQYLKVKNDPLRRSVMIISHLGNAGMDLRLQLIMGTNFALFIDRCAFMRCRKDSLLDILIIKRTRTVVFIHKFMSARNMVNLKLLETSFM